MTNQTIRITKICTAFALSFLFIFTALYSYWDSFQYAYELTFLSNFITGLFLLAVAILWICNKSVPQVVFLDFTILLLIVFGVCIAFIEQFNFDGGFLFLHGVNPLLMVAFYLLFSNQTKVRWQFLCTVLILPFAYLVFALSFGSITNNYIYFFLDYNTYGIMYTVAFIVGILVGIIIVSIALYYLNRFIHRYF